jgi:hypothetical protein
MRGPEPRQPYEGSGPQMALPGVLGQPNKGAVKLKDNHEILPNHPLPELESPPALAFVARDGREPSERLYALVCDPRMPARTEVLRALVRLRHPNLLSVMEWGVVDWPPEQRRCLAVILKRPSGARLLPPDLAGGQPMREERLLRTVLTPLIRGLAALDHLGFSHRSIRPDNIFVNGDTVALGDGYSSPAGLTQPMLFQTIERGMAAPVGRGDGSRSDDLYALGVTVLVLLLGRHPLPGKDDEAVLASKLKLGTFGALVGSERFSPALTEFLKGLLTDDAANRWTLEEVESWVDGRLFAPRHPPLPRRARRPFVFKGTEYLSTRVLAHDLARHWDEAGEAILSTAFEAWAKRGLGDDRQAENLLQVLGAAGRGGLTGAARDHLVARVLIALDPAAPIRFKGLAIMLDGFGPTLAATVDNTQAKELLRQVLADEIPDAWFAMQQRPRRDLTRHLQLFQRLSTMLEEDAPGLGMERWLYELNPDLACLSPIIQRYYVTQAEEIVPALEQAAQRSDRGREPIDRHLAAFIAARATPSFTSQLSELAQGIQSPNGALAGLDILASLQDQQNSVATPALADWLGEFMAPVINRFRSLERRNRLKRSIQAAISAGDLTAMLRILDNPREKARDADGYDRATSNYTMAASEIARLEQARPQRPRLAERIGAQLAVIVSTAIGSIVLLINFLVFAIL